MEWDSFITLALRLLAAAGLGALIGLERETHGRSAGLRTQLLVALGSATAMIVSLHFAHVFGAGDQGLAVNIDPARVAYGVMTGIGFLGAGTIIRYGPGVRGLTTAASLWCTAAVGLACGFGMYGIALLTTGIVLFALYILAAVDRLIPTRQTRAIVAELPAGGDVNIDRIRQLLARHKVRIIRVDYDRDFDKNTEIIRFHASVPPRTKTDSILRIIDEIPNLRRFAVE